MHNNGVQLLEALRSLGITVRAAGLDRLTLEPASKIPAEMVTRIREAKPAILEALREGSPIGGGGITSCGSPHCAGCYDVGDGRKIHPPRCGEEYRTWLERWKTKGKPQ